MTTPQKSALVQFTPALLAAERLGLPVRTIHHVIAPDELPFVVTPAAFTRGSVDYQGRRFPLVDVRHRPGRRIALGDTFLLVAEINPMSHGHALVGLLTDTVIPGGEAEARAQLQVLRRHGLATSVLNRPPPADAPPARSVKSSFPGGKT